MQFWPPRSARRTLHSRRGSLAAPLGIALLALSATPAHAAAPANDAFADAEVLSGATPAASGTTEEATKEAGEPDHAGEPGGHSVWYRWTAPASGPVSIDTAGSDLNVRTTLGVYTGDAVDALTTVASNFHYNSDGSRGDFDAVAGTTYRIAVDGWYSEYHHPGPIALQVAQVPPPANDDFADAETLSGSSDSTSGNDWAATREEGEPQPYDLSAGAHAGRTVWYRWTAPASGALTVDADGSSRATLIRIYTGDSLGELTRVAGDYDRHTLRVSAGTTYRIQLESFNGGIVHLGVELGPLPPNDMFADAVDLGATTTASTNGTNAGASGEPGEPSHQEPQFGFTAGASVWYTWKAPHRGSLSVRLGTDYYHAVAVYTGDTVSTLTPVAHQPLEPGKDTRLRIRVEAGVTYRFAVDSLHEDYGGPFSLSLSLIPSPANDDFADATTLAGLAVDVDGSNVGATQEPGEPGHADVAGPDPSVWYEWTAPADGGVTLDTAGSALPALLGIYTGDSLASLTRVPSTRSYTGQRVKRRFRVTAGVTYRIAVDSADASQDTFHLSLRAEPPPVNDDHESPIAISGTSTSVSGDNIGSTGEAEEQGAGTGNASVWYSWTAPRTGRTELRLTSDFTAQVGAYPADDIGSGVFYSVSPYAFRAVVGQKYLIRVFASWPAAYGEFTLTLENRPAPPNDLFADAVELSGDSDAEHGDNSGATRDVGEYSRAAGASVWYRWTAPVTGRADFELAGGTDNYDGNGITAYTGSLGSGLTPVGSGSSKLRLHVRQGVTYHLAVDSNDSDALGPFELRLVEWKPGPPNDMFDEPTTLSGSDAGATGSTSGATWEWYEPHHADTAGGVSIWYRWRAPASGPVTVSTAGSGIDTTLGVYTGDELADVAEVASNDDADGTSQSRVAFQATEGTTYRIAVDGAGGAEGPVALSLDGTGPPPAPEALAIAPAFGKQRIGGALARGLDTRMRCNRACSVKVDVLLNRELARSLGMRTASGPKRIGRARGAGGSTLRVPLHLTKEARRKLSSASKLPLIVRVAAASGRSSATAELRRTLKRK